MHIDLWEADPAEPVEQLIERSRKRCDEAAADHGCVCDYASVTMCVLEGKVVYSIPLITPR